MTNASKAIAIIQHQADEDEGYIKHWIADRQFEFERWLVWQDSRFTDPTNFDGVIILGGEADVIDRDSVSWMHNEIQWLRLALENHIPCFGICLGAQLLAHIMGAKIHRLKTPEKGVLPLRVDNLGNILEIPFKQLMVNQAHNYRFDIPIECVNYAQSDLCQQQLFINKNHDILGIQCHLEWSQSTMASVLGDDVLPQQLQSVNSLEAQKLLFKLLDLVLL